MEEKIMIGVTREIGWSDMMNFNLAGGHLQSIEVVNCCEGYKKIVGSFLVTDWVIDFYHTEQIDKWITF